MFYNFLTFCQNYPPKSLFILIYPFKIILIFVTSVPHNLKTDTVYVGNYKKPVFLH